MMSIILCSAFRCNYIITCSCWCSLSSINSSVSLVWFIAAAGSFNLIICETLFKMFVFLSVVLLKMSYSSLWWWNEFSWCHWFFSSSPEAFCYWVELFFPAVRKIPKTSSSAISTHIFFSLSSPFFIATHHLSSLSSFHVLQMKYRYLPPSLSLNPLNV